MNKIFIIDGNSLINRAYYALPPLATKSGEVYNAVFGFVNIVIKLITENNPTHMVVAFDAGNGLSIKSMFIGSVNYDRAIFGLRWRDSEMITIDLLEIRDNAAVTTTRYRPRFKNPDRRYNDFLLETAHVKNLKIGNNVQLSTSLFCHCKIENLSVGNNLQCNGLPLGVNIYKKNSPAWLQTAVFADAADLKRNAAQRGKKLGVYNCSVQKNVLFFFKGPKNQATKFILKKGSLQTCVCCGKDKLVQKEGKTICKKCGATYIFENPNS